MSSSERKQKLRFNICSEVSKMYTEKLKPLLAKPNLSSKEDIGSGSLCMKLWFPCMHIAMVLNMFIHSA